MRFVKILMISILAGAAANLCAQVTAVRSQRMLDVTSGKYIADADPREHFLIGFRNTGRWRAWW